MEKKSEMNLLTNEYDFSGKRSKEPQYFVVNAEVATHASNGKRKYVDTYKLSLKREGDKYTCQRMSFQHNDNPEVTVPSLKDWSYNFNIESLNDEGVDEQGFMLGIPHTKFEKLRDSKGKKVSIEAQYQVYSTFSYFHSFSNMIPEKESKDLRKVGDTIINDLTAVESPVNLGKLFLKGSKFTHGTETIQFKGISVVNDTICAIISLDERGGGFNMKMRPMPMFTVKTNGGTYFRGDIFIDLNSLHVKRVQAMVMDITKTTMYGIPLEVSVPVTTITIESVSETLQ